MGSGILYISNEMSENSIFNYVQLNNLQIYREAALKLLPVNLFHLTYRNLVDKAV